MEAETERRARLRQAAGEAIEAAIATDADPFDLMRAATGEGDNICGPYVQQHPLFTEKRQQFKTNEDRRLEALAAEPGPIVWVRRQFNSRKHAANRLGDVDGWHRSNMSGGIVRRANRYYLHGYV